MATVVVKYWVGTRECEARVRTIKGLRRVLDRHQNACDPRLYTPTGERLHWLGDNLVEQNELTRWEMDPHHVVTCYL